MAPTKTIPLILERSIGGILARQNNAPVATVTVVPDAPNPTVTVAPTNNNDSGGGGGGLDTGAIVGIVIGTIVGILLIIWAVRSLSSGSSKAPDQDRQGWYDDDRPRRSHHSHRHSRSHSHRRHRSSSRPVIIEKDNYIPTRPAAVYAYPDDRRRSRSQRRSRSRSAGHYAAY